MDRWNGLTTYQKVGVVAFVALVLGLVAWLIVYLASNKDSFSSMYYPAGRPQGDGPMQQRRSYDPYGSQLAKHSMMDHTGAGCGCSESLHQAADRHRSGGWSHRAGRPLSQAPVSPEQWGGLPDAPSDMPYEAAWGVPNQPTSRQFSPPSAVGMGDDDLAYTIGVDGAADL